MKHSVSWSYSALSCYEKCPAQYHYRYHLRLPEPKSTALQRGIDSHKEIEDYLVGIKRRIPKIGQLFVDDLKDMRKRKVITERRWHFDAKWQPTAERSWVVMVTDAHWVDGDSLQVIDFKTGKYYDTHIDQARLYGLGGLLLFPQVAKVEAKFMYLDSGGVGYEAYSRGEEAALKKDYEKRVAKLASDTRWRAKPNPFCRWCAFAERAGGPCKAGRY